jgi:hypothetical protein
MPPKKPYFGIKPFDEKRKKKYREPSIAEAFDAGQIRYYGLHAVSSLLGLLPRMKRSQLKELDKWTKVHYKLPIFKKSELLPEPEIIKPVKNPKKANENLIEKNKLHQDVQEFEYDKYKQMIPTLQLYMDDITNNENYYTLKHIIKSSEEVKKRQAKILNSPFYDKKYDSIMKDSKFFIQYDQLLLKIMDLKNNQDKEARLRESEPLPEPEVIDETLKKKNQAATKIQSLVRMKKAKKQLQTLKDNVRKKTYNDLIKMLETYKEIRQNADYYKNNRDEFQKKIKQFSTERSTLVDNKLDDLDHEIIASILKGIDKKMFTKLNELTKLMKYVNTIYENLGTSNEETEKNNLMKYIYPLVEDLL